MNNVAMDVHHAILHIGDVLTVPDGNKLFEVIHVVVEKFGIDDAHKLREQALQTPTIGTHRKFYISVKSMTTEAQNALLKLFEDPPLTSQFVLHIPREDILIPTLRSRLHLIDASKTKKSTDTAVEFLKLSYTDRLGMIAVEIKNENKIWMDTLITELEIKCADLINIDAQKALLFVRLYFHMHGASKKMLLEHIALSLPTQK